MAEKHFQFTFLPPLSSRSYENHPPSYTGMFSAILLATLGLFQLICLQKFPIFCIDFAFLELLHTYLAILQIHSNPWYFGERNYRLCTDCASMLCTCFLTNLL